MNAAAIICEYNPFHKGHLYHIAQTKQALGQDKPLVCLMSGGYVQRAQCAMLDKYLRAEAAIMCGADLVLELPITYAIASAKGFAKGGVDILKRMGCIDALSFGSESGELAALESAADILMDEQYDSLLYNELQKGVSFAAAREQAVAALNKSAASVLQSPNDILAVEYVKAIKTMGADITPLAIKRTGAAHDAPPEGELASASYLRKLMQQGDDSWKAYVPDALVPIYENELNSGRVYDLSNAEKAVLYRLRTMTNSDFDALPYISEGLNVRFMHAAREAESMNQAVEETKTKRYAHSRIRRLLLCSYLGIDKKQMELTAPYVWVLAFNHRGREVLRQSKLPVLQVGKHAPRLGDEAKAYFQMENRCEDLLSLCLPQGQTITAGDRWKNKGRYI